MLKRRRWISLVSLKLCILLFMFGAGFSLIACDGQGPDTEIDVAIDNKVPPTFSFSGPWWAIDFEVIELSKEDPSPENNYSTDQKTIWTISLPKGQRVKTWPKITYGAVPNGFSQTLPAEGKPPDLLEGKTYAARAIDTSRAGGAIYFAIRNGKIVSAPEANILRKLLR